MSTNMPLKLKETDSPLFGHHSGPSTTKSLKGAPSTQFPELYGYCPQCKTQLMWMRKKFNMGVNIFFETCPKCLPKSLASVSPQEATRQIETLQQNFEELTFSALCNPRDVRMLQTELQFMSIDIEKTGSTQDLIVNTSNYEFLVEKAAEVLKEKAVLTINQSRDERPTALEQVKELRSDVVKLLSQIEEQKEGHAAKSVPVYALVDVLKQLDQAKACANQDDKSLLDLNCRQEFQEEVDKLQLDLERVQHKITRVPGVAKFSRDVGKLNDGYSSLLQELKQDNYKNESEALRKKIEEMEKQHAAEVEALRSQLNTFMCTTVAADAVAADFDSKPSFVEETTLQQLGGFPSAVAEAEIVHDSPSTEVQSVPTAQVEVLRTNTIGRRHPPSQVSTVPGQVPSIPTSVNAALTAASRAINPTIQRQLACPVPSTHANTAILEDLNRTESVCKIVGVMKGQLGSAHVQSVACEKLGKLTCNSRSNVAMLVKASGIETVLKSMRRFSEEAKLQSCALLTLGNAASQSCDSRCKIGNTAGGIDLELHAMRNFPKDIQVQRNGLFAIGNASKTHEENTTKIGDRGGIDLILKGMREFPKDLQVQKNGLLAICNLAYRNDENKTRISDLNGIALVMDSMREFPEDLNIQRVGLPALSNLASNNPKNRSMIGDLCGTDLVIKVMNRFPKDAKIQESACSAILYLARSPKLRDELRKKGAVRLVSIAKSVITNETCAVNALEELRKGFS